MAAELRVTRLGREPFQHGPVDRRRPEVLNLAAECHLRVFKRSVAQLFCTQGLRVFANAMFDVVAVEAKFAPFTVHRTNCNVDVGMIGVVVVYRGPLQLSV